MLTMERGEVCTDNVERRGCGVASGLDRGHVDIVVDNVDKMSAHDMLAFQVLPLKATPR